MSLRRVAVGVLVLAVLGASLVLMVDDAAHGGDWPGWDEGWALFVFPLGIPVAVAARWFGWAQETGKTLPFSCPLGATNGGKGRQKAT